MKPINCNGQSKGKKISEQIVEFIDLTDETLEEINVPELGRIQGGFHRRWRSCGSCGFGSCSCGGFGFGSCGWGSCSCGSCGWGSCSCGSCCDFDDWD